ncbi:MAG: hypothetical protein WC827_03720 [Candidatus Paceibacterota bacterium]
MSVTDGREESWTEDITAVVPDGQTEWEHAQEIMKRFNDYLQKGEHLREVLMIRVLKRLKPGMKLSHNWQKHSLVTQTGGFNIMKCSQCGAMGKRHSLQGFTVIDRKYAKYESCPNKRV